MSNKRKRCFTLLSMFVVVNMITSMFLPSVSGNAATRSTNSTLEVNITSNKTKVESGDQIEFNLEYKVVGGQGAIKEGDVLEFNLPDEFYNIKPKYPPEHFKDVQVNGTNVRAIFSKGAATAIGGYMSIKATAKDVNKDTPERVEVNVNGVTKYLDISIVPKEGNPDQGGIIDRQLIKTVDGSVGYEDGKLLANISKPVIGKVQRYQILLNEKGAVMYNAVLDDKLPPGTVLLPNSIKVFEVNYSSGVERDVTNEFRSRISYSSDRLYINIGTSQSTYRIQYSTKYTNESDKYINTAKLSQYQKPDIVSSTIVRPVEKNDMVSKSYSSDNEVNNEDGSKSYFVSNIGDIVDYSIQVNPNNANMKNAVLEDVFPKGMELVDGSINISQTDENDKFSWVTNNFKSKINVSNGKMIINFGNTSNSYDVRYKLKVVDRYKEYNNNAKISYDGKSQDINSEINYELNAGAINAQKLVDKTEIKKGDNQLVTYTINFDCYGYFNQNYLKLIDELDSRLKIVSIDVPKQFTAKADGNKVTVVNDKGSIDYGEKLQVKIKADFSNVPNGTTIKNVAKIDKATTNEVETKKGYAFEAKKIDSFTKDILSGAKFEILNSDKQVVKTVTSDTSGIIKADLDSAGDYYIKEVEAPNGYNLDNTEKKFTIKDSDIGTVVNIGNIENNIKTGSVNLLKVDSETSEPLGGAEFKLYSIDNKEIGTYKTNKNGVINVSDLRPGKYYFEETKAPEGYNISKSKYEFEIELGKTDKAVEITAKNDIKLGNAILTKVDSETGQKLEGAEFDLYKINTTNSLIKEKIGSYKTNKSGEIQVSNLRPGNYYFVETKAPQGYEVNSNKQEFMITLGQSDKPVLITVKDDIQKSKIVVVKIDGETDEQLQGAVYGLYDSKDNLIEKVTTDENGQGIVNERLRPGNYYFKEITAPKGYNLNNEKLSFKIKSDGTSDKNQIIAKDSIILGSAKLIKVDSKTGGKLQGAVYGVYDSNNKLIEKVTTGSTGEVSTKTDLRPGKYYFQEITAPVGYNLNNTKYPFEIILGETNKAPVVTANDDVVLGSVSLAKVDSETGEKLQGATFDLYETNSNSVGVKLGSYTTDKNGVITVGDLRPGSYYFVETKAPEGYNLDNSKHEFKIILGEAEKQASVTVKDNIKK
uniref:SpaA isopeptide-forming pilin-related protein n=1 Tax=Clostridium sp. Ade.TY TaxID=1391647 RepID=UPI0004651C35